MKKTNILFIVLPIVLILSGCITATTISNINLKDKEGFIIGTSNKKDDNQLQIKVIIDKINIRKDSSVTSDKIGVVKSNSIFNVIDYKSDQKYIWFKIKTNNNIVGYVASEIENPYVETNKEIDAIAPIITIKNPKISIGYRTELENAVFENIEYYDNADSNLKVEYNVDYDTSIDKIQYQVNIKVTDESQNVANGNFVVEITGEKQMEDKQWLTYHEILSKQDTAMKLCNKYGLQPFTNGLRGCYGNNVYVEMSPYISIGPEICWYDQNMNPTFCRDKNGNNVSHELMSSQFITHENSWKTKIINYYKDVKTTTGYNIEELEW